MQRRDGGKSCDASARQLLTNTKSPVERPSFCVCARDVKNYGAIRSVPCLDGLSAAKEIHQLLPTVPIVLHTLYGTTEVEQAANKYGIRRVVAKAKPDALISAVEELQCTAAASQPDPTSDGTSEIPAPAD